jgi:hypothetical protein
MSGHPHKYTKKSLRFFFGERIPFFPVRRRWEILLWLFGLGIVPNRSLLIRSPKTTARFPCSTTTKETTTKLLCQLLGMNCATPTEFGWSWPDFCRRGGDTDVHADGWGLAYYHGPGVRLFHDLEAASTSALAKFLGQQPIRTRNMLAHIRYATSGTVDLCNVHPFQRE